MSKLINLKIFLFAFSTLFYFSFAGHAQVIKGVVSDDLGVRVPFAKIWVINTSYGSYTDGKGEYQLEIQDSEKVEVRFSAVGYKSKKITIQLDLDVKIIDVVLPLDVQIIDEIKVTSLSKRKKGKKIIKEVIDRRKGFLDAAGRYTCKTYCFTSLDKNEPTPLVDSLPDVIETDIEKMNITEWYGTSYYQSKNRYKDVITGFSDYSEKVDNEFEVGFGDEELGEPETSVETNPYIFINGLQDADINIFKNVIEVPTISQRPIISPLAYNALAYYNFYLESSFVENEKLIYEIRVEPVFSQEASFYGTIYVETDSYEPRGYELSVNKGAMKFFKEMRIICNYTKIDNALLPAQREFIYQIKEGKTFINGNSKISHDEYTFEYDDDNRKFWLETTVYEPEAFERDSSYWSTVRPFYLQEEEIEFIRVQDSIKEHLNSEEYLRSEDSLYNTLTVWDFLFNGVGFRNTFKKQEIWFSGLIEQVYPFGVGGYRHRLKMSYEKGFKNNKRIDLHPMVNYGFNNRDLKGSLEAGFLYNPMRFAHISFEIGDIYDYVNSYESIQGTFAPQNRVRNRKIAVNHVIEVFNGLYFRANASFSLRQGIENIQYPGIVALFGDFTEAIEFEDYSIFITEAEFKYQPRQKYILKGNEKIVTGTNWPTFKLLYRKGYPNFLGGQSDFDFLELGVSDKLSFNALGKSEIEFTAGAFLRKKDLRIIENKFFRTSDLLFFSDPTRSMQLLDTSLSTSNQYLQTNFIHHFNGFFLNKIWGLNRLGLEETIGGGLLLIPESNFRQVEFYVGIERIFRIKKQLFKLGMYAVTSDNNFDKANIRLKIGVNFYDSFRKKWDY